jgi:hypothetical protein
VIAAVLRIQAAGKNRKSAYISATHSQVCDFRQSGIKLSNILKNPQKYYHGNTLLYQVFMLSRLLFPFSEETGSGYL